MYVNATFVSAVGLIQTGNRVLKALRDKGALPPANDPAWSELVAAEQDLDSLIDDWTNTGV